MFGPSDIWVAKVGTKPLTKAVGAVQSILLVHICQMLTLARCYRTLEDSKNLPSERRMRAAAAKISLTR